MTALFILAASLGEGSLGCTSARIDSLEFDSVPGRSSKCYGARGSSSSFSVSCCDY